MLPRISDISVDHVSLGELNEYGSRKEMWDRTKSMDGSHCHNARKTTRIATWIARTLSRRCRRRNSPGTSAPPYRSYLFLLSYELLAEAVPKWL